jgi:hypothetical protein
MPESWNPKRTTSIMKLETHQLQVLALTTSRSAFGPDPPPANLANHPPDLNAPKLTNSKFTTANNISTYEIQFNETPRKKIQKG